ncbi:MAG: ABC-2 transporter permease [Candidatus Aminicenantes bacterium]|nr:ABC-2 transporter permease [Candidatus Aminicenantes bacterium]
MLKLVRLEVLLNRKALVTIFVMLSAFFAYTAYRSFSPRQYIGLISLVMGLAVPVAFQGREDRFGTSVLLCSLPARRSDVVLAKYAVTWAAIGLGLVYALALAALPFSKIPLPEVINFKGLLLLLFFSSLFFDCQLPLMTRFGFKGIMVTIIGFQLLGVLAMVFIQLFGGQRNPLRSFFLAVESFFRFFMRHEPTPGYLLLLGVSIVALNAGSFLIARALYARRDL